MKVGDIVWEDHLLTDRRGIAVVLYVNEEGGTVKALLSTGEIGWLIKRRCKVINESR